ncbi:DHA2 family efflux MFS transporter permease subunit [Bifidobacterium samirii]|uniref:Lincomycin resistance protein LmrB n=1 Tax=Bifidobacterium samirii TaxID=2306974 RepID=A0A430FUK8_9BIFI|nr:DHA2 family efflux MFS transporter permease subunit [Bifidobacterium samirii]RSX56987.1 lincomycin resistance protein LmrB [Bifidobacterium samirii]
MGASSPTTTTTDRGAGGSDRIEPRLLVVVVALAALTFLGVLSETSLSIAYSDLMGEFAINAATVQWLTTGYLLVLAVAIPTSPFLVRRFATKRLFLTAVLIFTAGTLLGAFAVSFPMLLAARLVMAVGTGVSMPLLTTIVLEQAPLRQRGMLLGIVAMVTCTAPALGPVYGGMVVEYLDWHWIFYIMVPFLVAAGAAGAVTITDIRKGERATISLPALLLVAVGLSCVIVACSFCGTWPALLTVGIAALAALALAAFAMTQLRSAHPLVDVRVFAHPGFTVGLIVLMLMQGTILGINFLLPILLQRGQGEGSMTAALVLLPGAACGALMSVIVGRLLGAHRATSLILIGVPGVMILELALLAFPDRWWTVLVAYMILMPLGGFVQVPAQTHSLNQLPERLNPDGSATLNTLQQLAGAIGTAVASTLMDGFTAPALADGTGEADAYVTAFSSSMTVFVGTLAVAFVLAVALRRIESAARA